MRQIFFDVSDLRGHFAGGNRVSGIQRVTLLVIDHAARLAHSEAQIFLSYSRRGNYLSVPYTPAPSPERLLEHVMKVLGLGSGAPSRAPSLEKYKPGTPKYAFHRARRQLNAWRGNEAHFARRGITIESWKTSVARPAALPQPRPAVVEDLARKGDVVVCLGAFWADPALPGHMLHLRRAGLDIATLIHDLIPILFPHFVAGHHGHTFHSALQGSVGFTTRYLANSACTARDLQEFLDIHGADMPVHTIPLAQTGLGGDDRVAPLAAGPDTYPLLRETTAIRDEIKALLKSPYALYVGTWDIRKNLWRLARAWERLSHDPTLEMPKLVLAGAPGWGIGDFTRLMEATGQISGLVELIVAPSDAELDFLYRHCVFTAFPSLYEGWGLPVGEGLSYGKTAIAAQSSSVPEVGGDLVAYCDPHSIASIAECARRLIQDEEHRAELERRIADARLRGWDDVAQEVLSVVTGRAPEATQAGEEGSDKV